MQRGGPVAPLPVRHPGPHVTAAGGCTPAPSGPATTAAQSGQRHASYHPPRPVMSAARDKMLSTPCRARLRAARHYRTPPPGDRPRKAPSAASGRWNGSDGHAHLSPRTARPTNTTTSTHHRLVGAGRRWLLAVGSTDPRANDARRDKPARSLPRSQLRALRALSAKGRGLPRTYRELQEFHHGQDLTRLIAQAVTRSRNELAEPGCARARPISIELLSVGLPRFDGRLRAVATGTGVDDSRWNEISLGERC